MHVQHPRPKENLTGSPHPPAPPQTPWIHLSVPRFLSAGTVPAQRSDPIHAHYGQGFGGSGFVFEAWELS